MSILVIVPTRGRPEACVELDASFEQTARRSDSQLLFAVDDDDPELANYQEHAWDWWASLTVGPRIRMVPTLNAVAMRCAAEFDVIGFMGDDHRPRTLGWDDAVTDALAAGPGVAYGNDLIHGEALPTAAFVSSSLIQRLGYMAPPGLLHMYADNFWLKLGQATSLKYLPGVVIEHLHPLVGKAEWSDQYDEVNALMGRDGEEFERYVREDWPAAEMRVRGITSL